MHGWSRRAVGAALVAVSLVGAACGGDDGDDDAAPAGGQQLSGTLGITAGECADGEVTAGSYFRMVQPGGTLEAGPFVTNGDSPCGDKTWTPLKPGSDGGLVVGDYQPHPEPAFEGGNALASAITEPTPWFAVSFGLATNQTDPQTETDVEAPTLTAGDDGALSGDLRAFAAAWNDQHFNQGVPKPDGSRPGNTAGPTGTLDADSGAYTLEWSSQIVGGPFNNFTGVWHLEGTFTESGQGD